MGPLRFTAILLVFGAVCLGWVILGASVWARTESLDSSLSHEMRSLWGPETLTQTTPYWSENARPDRTAAPDSSRIVADIRHEHRDKGLLWYSTFTIDFDGSYTLKPATTVDGVFVFPLPTGASAYNNLGATLDGEPVVVAAANVTDGTIRIPLRRDAEHVVRITYSTGGQNRWLYVPGATSPNSYARECNPIPTGELSELNDFSLTISTDFADIDYPAGSRSPSSPASATEAGVTADWRYDRAVTSQSMGIEMPRRPNAGPIVARMSFFAPVSLGFFFTVLFTVMVLKRVALHPMHYLFIGAGFFAFHILMAYLADIMPIHPAFWTAAAVSVALVASYMRLVSGMKFTLAYVCLAQLTYLVGFSYAFFWVGRTGLTVTIGAVLTLFVLMQATGRVKWAEVFSRRDGTEPAPPTPNAHSPAPAPL